MPSTCRNPLVVHKRVMSVSCDITVCDNSCSCCLIGKGNNRGQYICIRAGNSWMDACLATQITEDKEDQMYLCVVTSTATTSSR